MSLEHHREEPNAIQTNLGAIFVSLELSRSTWLITSLSPGGGTKMSKHAMRSGNVARLLERFAQLREKARTRTGEGLPIRRHPGGRPRRILDPPSPLPVTLAWRGAVAERLHWFWGCWIAAMRAASAGFCPSQ